MTRLKREVLIVEDDLLVRTFLARALAMGNYEPIEASTGKDALRLARNRPLLVAALIDGLLPDMHGVALAERLIEDPMTARVGICFVSGAIMQTLPMDAGVVALTKPVRTQPLLDSVSQLATWQQYSGAGVDNRLKVLERMTEMFSIAP